MRRTILTTMLFLWLAALLAYVPPPPVHAATNTYTVYGTVYCNDGQTPVGEGIEVIVTLTWSDGKNTNFTANHRAYTDVNGQYGMQIEWDAHPATQMTAAGWAYLFPPPHAPIGVNNAGVLFSLDYFCQLNILTNIVNA